MRRSVAMVPDAFVPSDRAVRAGPSYYALNWATGANGPQPGGVPAHQPAPEVPAREHPLPSPQEVPASQPAEVPVDVPQTPGPAAV